MPIEVIGVGGHGGPSTAAAATPPTNVWGFDSVAIAVGDGTPSFGGDGGPATAASVREPADVAVSANGATWYVTDTWNNRIRAVDTATGVITTVAGSAGQCRRADDPDDGCGDGGPATSATLNRPRGVALSVDGTILYIADTTANLVRAVTLSSGTITTLAGTGTEGNAGDGGPATSAQLAGPSGVAAASDGSVYVADTFNNTVRRIAPDGTISTFAGTGTACADPSTACGDGGPATSAQLSVPVGVAQQDAPSETIVVADTGDNRIRAITADGVIRTVAGSGIGGNIGDAGAATTAQLNQPQRAVVGTGGAVFIADTGNNRIRVAFLVPGTIWAVAGTGSPASGPDHQPSWATGLSAPTGLAVTPTGLAVADMANHVVRGMTAPHALLSFTTCGPNPATPGGRYSAEIPLGGLPTPSFIVADVQGGPGGDTDAGSGGGGGGYAHQTWELDPAAARLFAAVGCQGGPGTGDGDNPSGGGGGGASAIAAVTGSSELPLVIAGGGGGGGSAISPCQLDGNRSDGWSAGNGAQARGQGPSSGGGGGAGTGGVSPDDQRTAGGSGYGGPGGGGFGGGGGGWGLSFASGGGGAGGSGTSPGVPGTQGPCLGTGGGGGGWGGGAGGASNTFQGGSAGGNYGQCTDATQGQLNFGDDGSIVVEITIAAPASCRPTLGPDSVGATRDAAHARVWSAVDAVGEAQERHRSLPAPQEPRLDASSTVAVAVCPGVSGERTSSRDRDRRCSSRRRPPPVRRCSLTRADGTRRRARSSRASAPSATWPSAQGWWPESSAVRAR